MLGNYTEEKLDVTKIPGYDNPKVPKKRCPGCKLILPTSCFDTDNDAKDRLQGSCKFCQRQMHLKYLATLDGNITIQFKDISNRAQKKKLTFEITKQDIIDLYHKQNGLCALTGNVLAYTANMADGRHIVNPRNLSVDRIDSTKGYTKDNIQLVCAQINRIKDNLTIDKLIEICRLVVAE